MTRSIMRYHQDSGETYSRLREAAKPLRGCGIPYFKAGLVSTIAMAMAMAYFKVGLVPWCRPLQWQICHHLNVVPFAFANFAVEFNVV